MQRLRVGTRDVKLIAPTHRPRPGPIGSDQSLGLRYLTGVVTNLDEVIQKLEAEPRAFTRPKPTIRPGTTMAMVQDPDGTMVECVERGSGQPRQQDPRASWHMPADGVVAPEVRDEERLAPGDVLVLSSVWTAGSGRPPREPGAACAWGPASPRDGDPLPDRTALGRPCAAPPRRPPTEPVARQDSRHVPSRLRL
jgi:hypothetical protein